MKPSIEQTLSREERVALFPGSFNPFTRGHASIVERGLRIFDRIVIALGVNPEKAEDVSQRDTELDIIRRLYADEPRIEVAAYSGLTVDAAREHGAKFILRGVRSVKDFEYERDMADVNRKLSGIETVILYSLPELSAVSSSVVRELEKYGADLAEFLP